MATRFYLSELEAAEVNPAFAAWGESASAVRRTMRPALAVDPLTSATSVATITPGLSVLHRQFVSGPMLAGIGFVTTDTVSCQCMGQESAANDNIMFRVRCLKVVSRDGATIRATLLALGNAAIATEWNTGFRNLTYANAVVLGANYTTVAGDRLVLEVGHNDTAGVSISAQMRWGRDKLGTGDLPVDEASATTTFRPWFQISRTVLLEVAPAPVPRQRRFQHLIVR